MKEYIKTVWFGSIQVISMINAQIFQRTKRKFLNTANFVWESVTAGFLEAFLTKKMLGKTEIFKLKLKRIQVFSLSLITITLIKQ